MTYTVSGPTETFLGKTYPDWIEDWTRWFFLPNADQSNSGSVVFLKGLAGEGVIMVGSDSLEISESQRVLLPMITATAVAESGESSQSLYELVRSDIYNGDNPPSGDHVKIDDAGIILPSRRKLEEYLFETRVFQLNIPSASNGQSLADYVVPAIATRDTNLSCVTAGYFVLLKMDPGKHVIFSSVSGSRDRTGLYKATLFYRIVVGPKLSRTPITTALPISDQLSANVKAALLKKQKNGEIDDPEYKDLVRYVH